MRLSKTNLSVLIVIATFGYAGLSSAAPQWCIDQGGPPCKGGPGGGGEPTGSNNLSYPVIWSDNVLKPDFIPSDTLWTFAEITNPLTQCVQQNPPVSTVPADLACYYGQKNLGIDETTGDRIFEGPVKIWWLQQRQVLGNTWQVFNITDADAEGGVSTTPVVITGVDSGDLLESSITIKAKQVRTEFTLMKRVIADPTLGNATDTDYVNYLDFGNGSCVLGDNVSTAPNNCFAAHNMSGAVPGTDQSINEIQGSDFGDISQGGLLDPQSVKVIKNYFDPNAALPAAEAEDPDPRIVLVEPPVGIDATVYSGCARLVIQRITNPSLTPVWSSTATGGVANGTHGGYWTNGLEPPVVDVAAWGSGTSASGAYSAEINAGGSLIYGYNWNTKVLSAKGDYRLTFVLEGDACPHTLNTVFDETTKSVNVGERRPAQVVSAQDMIDIYGASGNEGGLAYVDVNIGASGGGGAGGAGGGSGGGSGSGGGGSGGGHGAGGSGSGGGAANSNASAGLDVARSNNGRR